MGSCKLLGTMIRHDWTLEELKKLHDQPLLTLLAQAAAVHSRFHNPNEIQICSIISVKTGGCPEDCKYCGQSAKYAATPSQPMLTYDEVMARASNAIARGATRICLAAAWRQVRDSRQFDEVLRMVRAITELGAEVCCTLGMLTACQAQRLKEAGLYAYNHNLDTSEGFYKSIITTRTYEDRLRTLDLVRESGMTICCGGILGIGETVTDRLQLILTLCRRDPHPESVPINKLSPTPGTPFGDYPLFPTLDMVRIIALARITMPHAMVRLAAGRQQMSLEEQALCFMAGANSLFYCEKFLVTPNAPMDQDDLMFERFKIQKRPAYA